jgi:hypothetical protein
MEVYKPFLFLGGVDADGGIGMGMAEVSIEFGIGPIRTASDMEKYEAKIEDIRNMATTANDHVDVIEMLGKVRGHGLRLEIGTQTRTDRYEVVAFITDGPTHWFIVSVWPSALRSDLMLSKATSE